MAAGGKLFWIVLILIFAVLSTRAANAATITVCSSGCDNSSIQTAVDAAVSGDSIAIQNGTYYENVNVTKSLNIYSNSSPVIVYANQTDKNIFNIIHHSGTNLTNLIFVNATGINASTVFVYNSSNNRFVGLNLSYNYFGIYFDSATDNIISNLTSFNSTNTHISIYDDSDNVIIENSYVYFGGAGFGVYGNNSDGAIIRDSIFDTLFAGIMLLNFSHLQIYNNQLGEVSNPTYKGLGWNWFGIWVDQNTQDPAYKSTNITISNNTIINSSSGIGLCNADNSIVNNNDVQSPYWNQGTGLDVCYSNNITVIDNEITECGYYGLYLLGSFNSTYANNNITTRGSYGFYLQGTNTTNNIIANNTIINSSAAGIRLRLNPENNLIYNNYLNNTNNAEINLTFVYNSFNTSLQNETSIIDGGKIGGNFYANPTGTGYSEICLDQSPNDGFCDSPKVWATNQTDYLPLTLNDTTYPSISGINTSVSDSAGTLYAGWVWFLINTSENTSFTIAVGLNTSVLNIPLTGLSYANEHSLTETELAEGTLYYYNVTICDRVGLCNVSGPYNFTTLVNDTTPPVLNVTSFSNNSVTSGSLDINFTVNDSNPYMSYVILDHGTTFSGPSINFFVGAGLEGGKHSIIINSTDTFGNFVVLDELFIFDNSTINMSYRTSYFETFTQAVNVYIYDANSSINLTGNESVESSDRLTLTFGMLNSSIQSVSILNFSASESTFYTLSRSVEPYSYNQDVNNSILTIGATPASIFYLSNSTHFLSDDTYTGKVVFNTTNLNYTYVHYCEAEDGSDCVAISQCTNNSESTFDGVTACFVNQTTNVTVLVPHFSSVVLALDDIVGTINITSPDNSSALITGSAVALNITPSENLIFSYNIYKDGNLTKTVTNNVSVSSFNTILNTSFNLEYPILEDGSYILEFNLTDDYGNNDQVNYTFNVTDAGAPTLSTSATNLDQYAATIAVTTNEYANYTVYYGADEDNLVNNETEGFSISPDIRLTGLNASTKYYYNVTVTDFYSNQFSISGLSFTTTDIVGGSSGGGGGGGGGTLPTLPELSSTPIEVLLSIYGKFEFSDDAGDGHLLKIHTLYNNSAKFTFSSDPLDVTLNVGAEKNIDVTGDGQTDVYMKVLHVSLTSARILIGKAKSSTAPTPTPTPTPTPEPEVIEEEETFEVEQEPVFEVQDPEPEIEQPTTFESEDDGVSSGGFWIASIIVIALLAGGGYFGYKKLSQPKQQADVPAFQPMQQVPAIGPPSDLPIEPPPPPEEMQPQMYPHAQTQQIEEPKLPDLPPQEKKYSQDLHKLQEQLDNIEPERHAPAPQQPEPSEPESDLDLHETKDYHDKIRKLRKDFEDEF